MILSLILWTVAAQELNQSLKEKLDWTRAEIASLTEDELKIVIYNEVSDLFILFINSDDFTSPGLIKQWTEAASLLRASNISTTLAISDVKPQKDFYKHLLIHNTPCAIFLRPGAFNKYTGPFDASSIHQSIITRHYLSSPAYKSPKSFTLFQYIHNIFTNNLPTKWSTTFNITMILSGFIGTLSYTFYLLFFVKT